GYRESGSRWRSLACPQRFRLVALQKGLEVGQHSGPAATDALQHGAAFFESFVDDGEADCVVFLRFDLEAHPRPGLGRDPGEVLVAPADRLGELGAERVPGVGQPAGRVSLQDRLLGIIDSYSGLSQPAARPLPPVRV